jgi:hypothetical protein
MIIKLTNLNENFDKEPFYFNINNIMSYYAWKDEKERKGTMIYGVSKDTWFVKETVTQITKLIKEAQNGV